MMTDKIEELEKYLLDLYMTSDYKNDFPRLFSTGVRLMELTDEEVAKEFSISRQTANRWKNGRAAPADGYLHFVIEDFRVLTADYIDKCLEKEKNVYDD